MTSFKKISVRPASKTKIRVSEKLSYVCDNCNNRYYSLFYFCPQCLGHLTPISKHPGTLIIVSIPAEKQVELAVLLQSLSGKKGFDFEKGFRSLPWTLIRDTDVAVLQHWKEVLEGRGVETEVDTEQGKKTRKRALFEKDAPLPFFLPPAVDQGMRNVGRLIDNATLRLQWVDAVLIAFRMIESSYKYHADDRILFSDLFYKFEEELQSASQDFQSSYKSRQSDFADVIAKLKSFLEQAEGEIQEIRRQVQEQL